MQLPLFVTVSGAPQTGKTTLCHKLTATLNLHGITSKMCSEAVRESMHFAAQRFTPAMHLEVFSLQLLNEARASIDCDIVILDRCVVDLSAYNTMRFAHDDIAREPLMKSMTVFCQTYAKRYGLQFITKLNTLGKSDSTREKEVLENKQIDCGIRSEFSRLNKQFREIDPTSDTDFKKMIAQISNEIRREHR